MYSIFNDLKNLSIFVLAFLLFVPPVQAHADAMFLNDTTKNHRGEMDEDHHHEHHKNETEDHKNTNHHHHCTMLGFSSAIISPELTYHFRNETQVKKNIPFYQKEFTSNYLDTLFEPPQTCSIS